MNERHHMLHHRSEDVEIESPDKNWKLGRQLKTTHGTWVHVGRGIPWKELFGWQLWWWWEKKHKGIIKNHTWTRLSGQLDTNRLIWIRWIYFICIRYWWTWKLPACTVTWQKAIAQSYDKRGRINMQIKIPQCRCLRVNWVSKFQIWSMESW